MEAAAAPLGVRKGAWTEEEDLLLKKCVEKFGEGKWYQAPLRSGLNRCRKSCRLRWLNYLKPTIKRGNFSGDEIDMMIRLHKLLGNKWSLIAGRLPGRTANDVKNYWNTHLKKKKLFERQEFEKVKAPKAVEMESKVIRPQPWTFSRGRPCLRSQTTNVADTIQTGGGGGGGGGATMPSPTPPAGDGGASWWETMVANMEEMNIGIAWSSMSGSAEVDVVGQWDEKIESPIWATGRSFVQEESNSDWTDIFIGHADHWQLTSSTQVGDD